jgi:N-methylhydantoinase B/oxoprolinase/acetone carboxylase alpha subunit
MTWYLYDSNGYVGDLASISGLEDLQEFIEQYGEEKLIRLFEEGWTRTGTVLTEAIEKLPAAKDKALNDTLENFKALVAKSQDIVIITDGTEFADDDTEFEDES